jgi:hypothetical protein
VKVNVADDIVDVSNEARGDKSIPKYATLDWKPLLKNDNVSGRETCAPLNPLLATAKSCVTGKFRVVVWAYTT